MKPTCTPEWQAHLVRTSLRQTDPQRVSGQTTVGDSQKPISAVHLWNLSNIFSRILAPYKIKTTCLSSPQSLSLLKPAKDILGLKAPGVYEISNECGTASICETDHSIQEGKKH
jgi:hypothetical protein